MKFYVAESKTLHQPTVAHLVRAKSKKEMKDNGIRMDVQWYEYKTESEAVEHAEEIAGSEGRISKTYL
jgi:hypothetical protein